MSLKDLLDKSLEPVPEDLAWWLTEVSNDLTDRNRVAAAADWCAEHDHVDLGNALKYFALCGEGDHRLLFTGSRRYGTPKPWSDFDWVVYPHPAFTINLDEARRFRLDLTWDRIKSNNYPDGTTRLDFSLKLGPLNLLAVSTPKQFKIWTDGTEKLLTERPVTRARAVRVFGDLAADAEVVDLDPPTWSDS